MATSPRSKVTRGHALFSTWSLERRQSLALHNDLEKHTPMYILCILGPLPKRYELAIQSARTFQSLASRRQATSALQKHLQKHTHMHILRILEPLPNGYCPRETSTESACPRVHLGSGARSHWAMSSKCIVYS
jgi:hypothetical protein